MTDIEIAKNKEFHKFLDVINTWVEERFGDEGTYYCSSAKLMIEFKNRAKMLYPTKKPRKKRKVK